jgi:hypothetical protein
MIAIFAFLIYSSFAYKIFSSAVQFVRIRIRWAKHYLFDYILPNAVAQTASYARGASKYPSGMIFLSSISAYLKH